MHTPTPGMARGIFGCGKFDRVQCQGYPSRYKVGARSVCRLKREGEMTPRLVQCRLASFTGSEIRDHINQ